MYSSATNKYNYYVYIFIHMYDARLPDTMVPTYDNVLIIILVVNFKLWPQLNKHYKKLVGCTTVFPLFSYTLVHSCLPTHAKNVVQQAFAQTRRDDDARAMPYFPHSLTTTDGCA